MRKYLKVMLLLLLCVSCHAEGEDRSMDANEMIKEFLLPFRSGSPMFRTKEEGKVLNTVAVQSTADNPKTASLGKTLPAGEYTGTLLGKSNSYLRPIELVDDRNARTGDMFLIHPNQFTNKDNNGNNGPWSKPYSAGCQITNLADFNEVMSILSAAGFKEGDTIQIIINHPPKLDISNNNPKTIFQIAEDIL